MLPSAMVASPDCLLSETQRIMQGAGVGWKPATALMPNTPITADDPKGLRHAALALCRLVELGATNSQRPEKYWHATALRLVQPVPDAGNRRVL
jgi:hypothetical protein